MDEKNYITPAGFERLKKELQELKYKERPEVTKIVAWAAENGDRSENGDYIYGKKRLRQIDSRIHFLSKRIDAAEVIDPSTIQSESIRFGATVTYENEDGEQKIVTIVGVDEVDPGRGRISWRSPIARALMGHVEGDYVTFNSPRGEQSLEIIKVAYIAVE